MRLRSSLLVLVAATVIPLVAFGVLASWLLVQHLQENFVSAVKDRNRAFMSAVDAELKGSIVTLQALAGARSLASGDLEAFYNDAAAVLRTQPGWLNLILHSPDGQQLVNAYVPWGTPLPKHSRQPASLLKVVQTQAPAIGGIATEGPFQKAAGVPVRVPVMIGGKLAYVLTAILKPEGFARLIASQQLPQGWVSGLVDADGRFVARVPAKPLGSMASRDYLNAVQRVHEGWYRGTTVEGLDTYTAHVASDLSGWTVGLAIPSEQVLGGAKRAAWLMGGGALFSLALAIGIALGLGRRIARPMSQLASGALQLGADGHAIEVDSDIREVAELAGALNKASQEIRERDSVLRRRAEDLQRADRNKSQFLALLSHELRNPLAPLLNGLLLLKLRGEGAGEVQAMMERQIGHLRRLIDDLLDVSRIDLGKLDLRRERVAVDAVVRSAIETAKPNIEAKSHALLVRYAPEPLYVEGDALRLSQVVSNLLNNAAKFTPAGGRIEIATRLEAGCALVSVKDTGIGLAPGDERRIFEMFVQVDASRTKAAGGLGLGLTLVRSLVEMHGGRIEAHSAGIGRGAEFVVRLPLAAAPAASAAATPALPSPRAGRKVLVVDDNADAADSLVQILRLKGFDALACYDGEAALNAAQELKPEVAFLDLNMPGMNGTELAARLRAQAGHRAIKLIALTGMGQKSDLAATRAAGFDAHVTKPASLDEVVRLASADERGNVIPLLGERSGG